MEQLITRIIRSLNDEHQALVEKDKLSLWEDHVISDLERMIEEMEDFDLHCVFNTPTPSWNARQIIMSYIMTTRLDTDVRDGLFQRAEAVLTQFDTK